MATAATRVTALGWYKRILRARYTFPEKEKNYIYIEARRLYTKNKNITDFDLIEEKLFEAEARYGLAIHYKNPYPRLPQYDGDPTKKVKIPYLSSYDL